MRHLVGSLPLALEEKANGVRSTLADHQFQLVTEREQPAMASDRAHFLDMIDVHDRVSVHSLKR